MSYLSRLYNHRNAQTQEGKENKPFFSKQHENKSTDSGKFFLSKGNNAAGVQKAVNEKEKEKPIQKMEELKKKDDKLKAGQAAGTNVEKEKEKPIQKKEEPKKEDDKLKAGHAAVTNVEKEKEKPIQKKEAPKEDDKLKGIQKKDEENEMGEGASASIQRKPNNNVTTAPTHISSQIEGSAGKGNALPKNTLHEMNRSFGADFSNVHIHNDSEAAHLNKELNAHAFTHGNDIYFNNGKYNPASEEGKHLLAHELTHVVQQGAGKEQVQRDLAIEPPLPDVEEPVLTPKQVRNAKIYNKDRYGEKSTLLIQDVVGASATGEFDDDTIRLIALYQAQNGLTTDGAAGPVTFNQMTAELEAEGVSDDTCLSMFRVGLRTPMEIHAGAVANTANIFGHFDVEIRFSPHCDCSKFEYRQFISGQVTLNGASINNQFSIPPGNVLPATGSFIEDGNTTLPNNGRYGHRNLPPNQGVPNRYVDASGNVDMANGCTFFSFDEPGVVGGPANTGDTYVFDFRFFGDIHKGGKMIERKFWAVRESITIP